MFRLIFRILRTFAKINFSELFFLIVSFYFFTSCGGDKAENNLNFPIYSMGLSESSSTVIDVTPLVLQSSNATNCSGFPTNYTQIIRCLTDGIFGRISSDDAYFLKWVRILDNEISNLNFRHNKSEPACWGLSPINKDIAFEINGSTITQSLKLSCYEQINWLDPNESQDLAIGKKDGVFYFIFRHRNTITDLGDVVMGSKEISTNEVKVWLLQYSGSLIKVSRTLANKNIGTFIYNAASTDFSHSHFCRLFASSDSGPSLFLQASIGGTIACQTEFSIPNLGCVSRTNLSAPGSDCTNLKTIPTSFGPTSIIDSTHLTSSTLTNIKSIFAIDYSDLGISKFP